MTQETITITLCRSDAERVVDSLRQAGLSLMHDANAVYDSGEIDYSDILFNEAAYYLAVADDVDFMIPE